LYHKEHEAITKDTRKQQQMSTTQITGKRVLFIDRDGTLINEAPPTYQLDSFDKLSFYPDVFFYLRKIAAELDYELVMPTNQDGLGTDSFPEDTFWPVHNFVVNSL
jgi:imidazoleglycerol-phosphate dehydratase/histidinol-phosphatase